MTKLIIDLSDVAGGTHPEDTVVVWSPVHREGSAGRTVSPTQHTIRLTEGVGEREVEPGPLMVQTHVRAIADTRPKEVVVPDQDTVTLWDLLEQGFTYTPPIISEVSEARAEVREAVARVGTAEQVGQWAEDAATSETNASTAASDALIIKNSIPATVQSEVDTRVPPKVAEVIGQDQTVVDAASAAVEAAADSIAWVRPPLADGTDFDDVRTSGMHPVTTADLMKSMLNRPDGATGTGVLIVRNVQNTVFQELWWWASSGMRTAHRVTSSGVFGAWQQGVEKHSHVITDISGLQEALDQAGGGGDSWIKPAPAEGTDFDAVRTSGTYPVPTADLVKSMLNRPDGATGTGVLIVYASGPTIFQEFLWWTSAGVRDQAHRVTSGGVFNPWTRATSGDRDPSSGWLLDDPVYFWGDSAVDGGDTNGPWATGENLSEQLNLHVTQEVDNRSRAGDTSNATLLRAGIIQPPATPSGGVIPASGTVNVETYGLVLQMRANRQYDVTWSGVDGRLTHLGDDAYTFTRSAPGHPVTISEPVPIISRYAVPLTSGTHIFLTGGNDWDSGGGTAPEYDRVSHVVSSYARAVEAVAADPTKHVLIGGVKTRRNTRPGDENDLFTKAVNTQLKEMFPHIFVDRNQWLVEHGLDILGLTAGVDPLTGIDERSQIAASIVPARVYADNDYTHAKRDVVAAEARDLWAPALARKGWAELTNPNLDLIYPHPVNTDPTGMVLRKDTTLGTRFMAGNITLFGDTDWYDITPLLDPQPVGGSVKISRKGGHIVWQFAWLQYGDTGQVTGHLPEGWRSGVNDRADVRDGAGAQVANLAIPWGGDFTLTVNKAGYLDDVVALPDLGAAWPTTPPAAIGA